MLPEMPPELTFAKLMDAQGATEALKLVASAATRALGGATSTQVLAGEA